MNKKPLVIMCLYKRHNNLDTILNNLSEQTYKNFKYVLWDNSDNKNKTKKIIQNYTSILDIDLIESKTNVGGIGRFYAAASFANDYETVIFFDDDQIPQNNFISTMLSVYEKKTIKSKRAFKILNNNNYWIRTKQKENSSFVNYCSTNGMVLPSIIFKNKEVLECPEEYKFIEDLWLSYYAQHILKWKLMSIAVPLKKIKDEKDQYHNLIDHKNKFLQFLTTEKKWNLDITY